MDVERTIQFILEQQAQTEAILQKLAEDRRQGEARQDRMDRRLDNWAKLGLRAAQSAFQQIAEQREADNRMRTQIESISTEIRELKDRQRQTDEQLRRTDERLDRFIAKVDAALRLRNGHGGDSAAS